MSRDVFLEPCPFCGSERLDNLQGDRVHCIDCGACGPSLYPDMVEAWNARIPQGESEES